MLDFRFGRDRLEALLARIGEVRAVLIGDLCLDVYWFADMTKSVLSRETAHFPLPVTEERMSAGAGGNAAADMAALCPNVIPVGVVGKDWRGDSLLRVLSEGGMDVSRILRLDGRMTSAYCKPMRMGYLGIPTEDPRLDFESAAPLSDAEEDALIANLEAAVAKADVLCVSDQLENGCITPRVRERINALAAEGLLVVVDSRSRIGQYRSCVLKPNEIECARALGLDAAALGRGCDEIEIEQSARALSEKNGCDVCLTLGDRGALLYRGGKLTRLSAIPVSGEVDTVGAGDCFLSAFSLALAAGATDAEALRLGTMASAICVKKLHTTGSASAAELCDLLD